MGWFRKSLFGVIRIGTDLPGQKVSFQKKTNKANCQTKDLFHLTKLVRLCGEGLDKSWRGLIRIGA